MLTDEEAELLADRHHPGHRVKAWRDARGWTLEEAQERSGVDKSTIWRIEKGQSVGRLSTLFRLINAYGRQPDEAFRLDEVTPSPGLHVPIEAELVDGTVRDNTLKYGLQREGPAPRVDLVQVEGAGEHWKGLRVQQRAWAELEGGAVYYDLRPGDLLILAPVEEIAPTPGALVVATKKITSAEELEAARNEDGHVVIPRELRVYLEVHGQTWLWPLQGEGQPTTAVQPVAPWRVVEVAVKQRRELVPEIEGG